MARKRVNKQNSSEFVAVIGPAAAAVIVTIIIIILDQVEKVKIESNINYDIQFYKIYPPSSSKRFSNVVPFLINLRSPELVFITIGGLV